MAADEKAPGSYGMTKNSRISKKVQLSEDIRQLLFFASFIDKEKVPAFILFDVYF